MPPLPAELRSSLETSILKAREAAERAAEASLLALAVDRDRPFSTIGELQRQQRNALRARARQLRDELHTDGWEPLIEEVAYVGWHRMLFARFLAENNLLMHPDGVPVTLQDCADLAPEEGEPDAWSLAARYASLMLPGIFRQEDPSAQVRFAPEGRNLLERILMDMPQIFFTADDALGWVYQFWQSKVKEEVDKKVKIGGKVSASDLAPKTQLFTENYMVRYLLENSLGAWWAFRHPDSSLIKNWTYLRWNYEVDNLNDIEFEKDNIRIPAAGTFLNWPSELAKVKVMDPCCGSGHFLVAAFDMLYKMRMESEGVSKFEAVTSVIRNNLFGLEIDPRCTQIASFAVILAAWKIVGFKKLPIPNIACSGIPVEGQLNEWIRIGGKDSRSINALDRLYRLFKQAPTLGSLINPSDLPLQDRMFIAEYEEIAPLLEHALSLESSLDPTTSLFGAAVEGTAKAAKLLADKYTLIVTNVPFLKRGNQNQILRDFSENYHSDAKADLATTFIDRCISLCEVGGSCSFVSTQYWLFLSYYQKFRVKILRNKVLNHLSKLGPSAFETISGAIVNVALIVITNSNLNNNNMITGLDVTNSNTPVLKARNLRQATLKRMLQAQQLENPDQRISLEPLRLENIEPFSKNGTFGKGSVTGDKPHYIRYFWEIPELFQGYEFWLNSPKPNDPWSGREHLVLWNVPGHNIQVELGLSFRGQRVWGKSGVAISKTNKLICAFYDGELFDDNLVVLIPNDETNLDALWYFCKSEEFVSRMRALDAKLSITAGTFEKVPFDLLKWNQVAMEAESLPDQYSNDPTQWIFDGQIMEASEPLQVAIANLLGYRWIEQKHDNFGTHLIADGIICLPSVSGKLVASESLRKLLVSVYGSEQINSELEKLLSQEGYAGRDLSEWLKDGFFSNHCRLFKNRPFIWHIWDGRKDGFSALVNYHKLDHALLGRLVYTYLGDWINRQRQDVEVGVPGAEGRLVAALQLKENLEMIREGEPPYDIYVRWKPLHEQPIGWNPDLNDGVRLNIRPFVTAGILRSKFTINWKKDRGKDPDGSERINDLHFTISEKLEARKEAGLIK